MAIWSAEIKELEKLYDSIKSHLPELERELEQLLKFDDPNVIMLYSRRCLEVIISDLCECELKRPRKTEPLKGIIDKLRKEEKVPSYIISSMHGLNELSTYGAHPKDFVPEQVKPVLNNLDIIIKWYLKYKETDFKGEVEKAGFRGEISEEIKKEDRIGGQWKRIKLIQIRLLYGVLISAILVFATIFTYQKNFNSDKLKDIKDTDGRISIAVTNFDNNTNDTTLNWLSKGIPELIRNNLTGSSDLSVQNSQTMFELYESMGQTQNASVAPSLSREAAIKLKTGTYITGSLQKFGDKILTYIKLIDTKNDELLWTGSIEGNIERYKYLADSIAVQLKDFLEIKALKQKTYQEFIDINTSSPEALRKYILGMQLLTKGNSQSAIQSFQEAYEKDTTFTLAAFYTAYGYTYQSDFHQGRKWVQKAYRGKDRLSMDYQLWLELWKANDSDGISYYNDLLENSEIKSRFFWFDIAYNYNALEKYDKSVKAFEKIEKLNSEWGENWKFRDYYIYFGMACHNAGIHEKEANIFETGLNLYPAYEPFIFQQAKCALMTRDTVKATELINLRIKLAKEEGSTEVVIENILGNLYAQANLLDIAELHFRKALQLNPHDSFGMLSLINILLQNDKTVTEGIALVDTALTVYPDEVSFIRSKGIGYYKLGKYPEALQLLTIYKDKNDAWDPEFDQYFKKVKEEVSKQKNN